MRKYALCFIAMLFFPQVTLAETTLSSVLGQIAKQDMVALEYREIKHIIFLQNPVIVSGRIFLKGDGFVLEQLKPERILMSADKQRFRFFIPAKHVYHSKMMTSPMVQKAMRLFKPLILGDEKALKRAFDVTFRAKENHWILKLIPKGIKDATLSSIEIKGKVYKAADYALITMTDGSTSEWFFSSLPASKQNASTMQKLLVESKG